MAAETTEELLERIRELQHKLDEAEETLSALRSGEVDAVVASGPDGDRVYTLKGADEGYRVMVQNMADGALTVTLGGLILFSNEQCASMLGVGLEHVIGSSIYDFVVEEDAPMLSALLTSPAATKAEFRLKQLPSGELPAQLSSSRILFDGAECICLILTDLTEQKRNQAMVAAERLARSILDQAAGAILVLDPAGKIIRASRAAEQLAGETVLLRHFDDVFRLRDPLEKGDCTLERVLARVQREGNLAGFEAAVRRADGRMLDVMVSASFLTGPGGELLGSIVLLSDLSALKRAEEALRKSEERFRALVTASSDAVYRMSPDWSEMRRLYGRDFVAEMETPTRHWLQDIHPDDRSRVMAVVNEAIRTKGIFELEHRVQRVDGSLGWTFSRAVPLQDGNGEILEWFGAASDITERKRAEERLRESQKLESIGLLAGGVAHDFNNILTVIMGSASIALEERSSCEHARSILSAAERASDLTRQLLAYAGKGQVVRQLIDLSELVSRSTDLLRATVPKRVELELSLAPDLPCVEADPSQVEQILMNLVINAGEAISPKTDGLIKIYTRICEVTPDMVREFSGYSVEAGEYVCLEVQDNGAGMNESTVSHVFDPFFTTKFSGRGLGLAAVHGIVRSSKGLIRLRSHPGEGTTFQVFLPATRRMESTERKVPTLEDAGALQHGPATVLVVDDEETVRRLARLALNRYGYQVLEAENGKEALEVLRSARSAPDVVLLDQAMPVMGGDELLPILAVKYPGLKILMSSGYPEEEACKASPAGTITSFLRKPYTISALAEKIAETLRRAR